MRNLLRVWAFVGTQFIVSAPAIAQAPDTLWTRTYGGAYNDYGYSVQECANGDFIIAGGTESFSDWYDVYLIRTDADGDTLWTKTYGGTCSDYGCSVQECAEGGFIIAGATGSFGAGSYDVYLIRTNADGDTLWTKTYGRTGGDYGCSVQECDEGGFIIAGKTYSFGVYAYFGYLIRTNANGDTLWTKTYSRDYGCSVQECASGGFIIAGETDYSLPFLTDIYLMRTDSDGTPLWTKTYGGTGYDGGNSVQECDEGGFIIAGRTTSFGAGSNDVYLVRTDTDGNTLWTKTYGETNPDYGYSVQECDEGGFIIAGYTRSFGAGGSDVYLIRTDTNGDTLWTKTYGGTGGDYGKSVQECVEGGFIIAGRTYSFGAGGSDVYLIRISETRVEERNERLEIRDWRLQIYPNPCMGKVVIKLLSYQAIKGASIKIHDISGKLVKHVLTAKQGIEINLEELTNGIYFVRVETNNYKATRKLTILR